MSLVRTLQLEAIVLVRFNSHGKVVTESGYEAWDFPPNFFLPDGETADGVDLTAYSVLVIHGTYEALERRQRKGGLKDVIVILKMNPSVRFIMLPADFNQRKVRFFKSYALLREHRRAMVALKNRIQEEFRATFHVKVHKYGNCVVITPRNFPYSTGLAVYVTTYEQVLQQLVGVSEVWRTWGAA